MTQSDKLFVKLLDASVTVRPVSVQEAEDAVQILAYGYGIYHNKIHQAFRRSRLLAKLGKEMLGLPSKTIKRGRPMKTDIGPDLDFMSEVGRHRRPGMSEAEMFRAYAEHLKKEGKHKTIAALEKRFYRLKPVWFLFG